MLAFVPMLLCSVGFSELNKSDPDCGTTFIWGARAFGPKTGWAGGRAIVAADVLVMTSLAQVAGQYLFFLIQGPDSAIGRNASGGWVLLRDTVDRLQRILPGGDPLITELRQSLADIGEE